MTSQDNTDQNKVSFLSAIINCKEARQDPQKMQSLLDDVNIKHPKDIISITALINTCSKECTKVFLNHEATRDFLRKNQTVLVFFFSSPYRSLFIEEKYQDPTMDSICKLADIASNYYQGVLRCYTRSQ